MIEFMNKRGTKTNMRTTKKVFIAIIVIITVATTSCYKHDNTLYITPLFVEQNATFVVVDIVPLTMFLQEGVLENTALKWHSDNESVAVINDKGYVRGLSEGSAIITCTAYKGKNKNDFSISFIKSTGIIGEYKGRLFLKNEETTDSDSSVEISAICVDGIDFGFIRLGLLMKMEYKGKQIDIDCNTINIWAESDKYRLWTQIESEDNQSIVVGGAIDPRNSSIDLSIVFIDWATDDVNSFKFEGFISQ
jgi:hypothetical protein